MTQSVPYRLGALLVCRGLITEDQLSSAVLLQRQGNQPRPLGEVLIEMGLLTQKDLNRCLKRQKCLRWYAALAACISAPSAAFAQCVAIEDCPEYQHTQVAELDAEGFHSDVNAHINNATQANDLFVTDSAAYTLGGAAAVSAAIKTAAKIMWSSYNAQQAEETNFDFAVAASSEGYGVKMSVYF